MGTFFLRSCVQLLNLNLTLTLILTLTPTLTLILTLTLTLTLTRLERTERLLAAADFAAREEQARGSTWY